MKKQRKANVGNEKNILDCKLMENNYSLLAFLFLF